MVVDLPDPLGPSRPKISCGWMSKLSESTARARLRIQKSRKTFVRLWHATTGVPRDDAACWFMMLLTRCRADQFGTTRSPSSVS